MGSHLIAQRLAPSGRKNQQGAFAGKDIVYLQLPITITIPWACPNNEQ
jgi:hypothetical protein